MKKELENFLEGRDIRDSEDMNKALGEFTLKCWKDFANHEISPEHMEAHQYLEKWEKYHHEKDLKKVLSVYPDCFLAKVYLSLNKDRFTFIKELEVMLDKEEKRINKTIKQYKKSVGFTLDGEDYFKGMYELIKAYMKIGGYFKASKLAEKILLMDNADILEVRILLVGLYAYLEEESKLIKLYKSRKEEYIPYYIAFMCLYYKRGDFDKAHAYLELIKQNNTYFLPYIEKGVEKDVPKTVRIGEESEVVMIMKEMKYLFDSTPYIDEFIKMGGNI